MAPLKFLRFFPFFINSVLIQFFFIYRYHFIKLRVYALGEISVKHSGDLSVEQIINIARKMRPRSVARKLEGTVKEILGN